MGELGSYNGFSGAERNAKLKSMQRRIASGEMSPASGCCALCGDPEGPLEYHDEDYGRPYLWTEPAIFILCRHCHREKLHKRFNRPTVWQTFLAHVRRGGYARDLKNAETKREFDRYRAALDQQETPDALVSLRPYARAQGEEWFAKLRMDPESLTDPAARPRSG